MATYFYISSAVVSCMSKSIRLWERFTIEDLWTKWKTSTWTRLFGECSRIPLFQAAVHLGQECDQNLRFVKSHFWSSLTKLFKETEKLIKDQKEITGASLIYYEDYTWSTKLAVWPNLRLFADSVLCLWGIKENPNEAWKEKIKW